MLPLCVVGGAAAAPAAALVGVVVCACRLGFLTLWFGVVAVDVVGVGAVILYEDLFL